MKDLIRTKLYQESKGSYHDYGRFAIEFEQMVLSVKLCIFKIVQIEGSEYRHSQIRILLHDQTASPMIQKLQSLINDKYNESHPEIVKMITPVITNAKNINEIRNILIHSSIFISNLTGTEDKYLELYKDKIGKYGVKALEEEYTQKRLIELTAKVIKTKNLLDKIAFYEVGRLKDLDKYFNKEVFEDINVNL